MASVKEHPTRSNTRIERAYGCPAPIAIRMTAAAGGNGPRLDFDLYKDADTDCGGDSYGLDQLTEGLARPSLGQSVDDRCPAPVRSRSRSSQRASHPKLGVRCSPCPFRAR
jgi:hypothetical protein